MALITSREGWSCEENGFISPNDIIGTFYEPGFQQETIYLSGCTNGLGGETGEEPYFPYIDEDNNVTYYGDGIGVIAHFSNGAFGFIYLSTYHDPRRFVNWNEDRNYIINGQYYHSVDEMGGSGTAWFDYLIADAQDLDDFYGERGVEYHTWNGKSFSVPSLTVDGYTFYMFGVTFYELPATVTISTTLPEITVNFPMYLSTQNGTQWQSGGSEDYKCYWTESEELIEAILKEVNFNGLYSSGISYLDKTGTQLLISEAKRRINLKQDTIQYTQMPTASEDLLDHIYQYIGQTDSSYVNGYFYKCVSDSAAEPTYSWVQIGSGRTETVLWENTGTTNPDTITLSEAWSDFDELGIVTDYIENNIHIWSYSTIKNTYNIGDNVRLWFYDQNVYAMYAVTSSTVLTKYAENGGDWVSKIIGIKYGSGGGGDDFSAEQKAVINSNMIALSYPNLVNKDAATKNGYYDATGTWISAEGFYQSDYIPVTEGKVYTSRPHNVFVLWYDANKNYIGKTESVDFDRDDYVIAPVDAKYSKFMTTSDYYDTWQVENSMFSTEYVPYGEAVNYKNTSYNGMSGVAFGTSITARAYTHGIGYLIYLQRMSGVVWDVLGIGSGRICTDDTNYDILAKIKSKDSAYYTTKGVCILEGFVNDWYQNSALGTYTDTGETTACGCLRSAINHILTANPTITLFIVFDHYGKGITAETVVNASGLSQYDYYETLAKVAGSMGVPVIKVYESGGINHYTGNEYLADNIHLNVLGSKQEANTIWQGMTNIPAKITG